MRGGFLPPAILAATLGIALAFASPRRAIIAAGLMLLAALAVWWASPPSGWIEAIFLGCWLSVILTAALVHRPMQRRPEIFPIAGANAGLWAGAATSVAGQGRDLAIALPFVLLFAVGRPFVNRHWSIGLKVVASWLTAVAILATMVSLTPTPGYKQDHME